MISKLQYITQVVPGFTHAELAEFACKGGVKWIQLRVKPPFSSDSKKEDYIFYQDWKKNALETKLVCKKYGAKLIINDSVELALEIKADGVHLGMNDLNPKEAREILGKDFIIGGTAHNLEEVKFQVGQCVDYIGIGPYRFTHTKFDLSPVIGLKGITDIIKSMNTEIPFIAIGGITEEDVEPILAAGIYGLAVSSVINLSGEITETAKKFMNKIKSYHG